MNYTNKETFEELWTDFLNLVKGKLITAAKRQTLSTALANLILSDAGGLWTDEYSIYGSWMVQLARNDSSKAELVKEILHEDMRFSDVEKSKILPTYCNYLIPGVGSCAGYAMSCYFELGKIAQLSSVLLPAVLLYPVVKIFRYNQIGLAIDKCIESYMMQLDKYKNSVLSILA